MLFILLKIHNILTGCYIWYQSNGFQKILGSMGSELTVCACEIILIIVCYLTFGIKS